METRAQLERLDGQALKHRAQDMGVLNEIHRIMHEADTADFRNIAIQQILLQYMREERVRKAGEQRTERLNARQQEWIDDLPKYTLRDLQREYVEAKMKGDGFRKRHLESEMKRRGLVIG
jgi:hypothetical protein